MEIGINRKLNDSFPKIIIMGFAPAGGWTVLVIIIMVTANPTAKPIEIKLTPKKYIKYIMKSSLDTISSKPLNSSKFFRLKKDAN